MSETLDDNTITPPEELPADAAEFWGAPPTDLPASPMLGEETPVIDQLGSAPFKKEKGGFPFLGFLASVYEHVSTTALAELHETKPVAEAIVPVQDEQSTATSEEPTDVRASS